jgi:hypothetical protein
MIPACLSIGSSSASSSALEAHQGRDLFSLLKFAEEESEMSGEHRPWQRYCEAFWRAHHEAWKNSDLNQREYCEAQGIQGVRQPRAKFKAEP